MRYAFAVFLSFFIFTTLRAQRLATLEVTLPDPSVGMQVPVQIDLDGITFAHDSLLNLVVVNGNKRTPVPYQIDHADRRTLHWIIESSDSKVKQHVFELMMGDPRKSASTHLTAASTNGSHTIQHGNKKLMRYQYETLYPPKGVDSVFARSAFIHPLWSPHGQVLTRIQPPDHYHHYGIWNPWTRVLFRGDTIDFWNLYERQGTVRFANFLSRINGPVFSEYQALHEHVALKGKGAEEIVLHEVQSVRVYRPSQNYYLIDFDIQMSCASEDPVLLLEYRYGGFGWRTTEQWHKGNSEVITSEGKTRKDADGSTARWCIVQGEVDQDYAGVVMMSYPANYNHPEPLRIWPESMYNRGDMFANFATTKNTDWKLNPGQRYILKYRLLVFNDKFTKEKAERAWQYYSSPPKVSIRTH
ncbi:MAG TPA: PmoA family protein [Ohtaekwangia sp.]|nr:PmoA family protein [Ohtaekwangia sp.]